MLVKDIYTLGTYSSYEDVYHCSTVATNENSLANLGWALFSVGVSLDCVIIL